MSNASAERTINFTNDAPTWRTAAGGLSLEGTCRNRKCEAYKESVVMSKGYKDFDLVRDSKTFRCPACKQPVAPRKPGAAFSKKNLTFFYVFFSRI